MKSHSGLEKVTLTIVKTFFKYRSYAHGYVSEEDLGDRVRLTFLVENLERMARWLLAYGNAVEIEHPERLRSLVAERAEELHRHYPVFSGICIPAKTFKTENQVRFKLYPGNRQENLNTSAAEIGRADLNFRSACQSVIGRVSMKYGFSFGQTEYDFALTIITGICSYLSSYIFLMFFLRMKKPRVEISNYISKYRDEETRENVYCFKIRNRTNCSIYSVEVSACFMTPVGADGGQNLYIKEIPIRYDNYSHISPKIKTDVHALHAVRIRCFYELEEAWGKSTFLRFEVFAKHELSGFSKIFIRDYHNNSCIKAGQFKFGDELTIS